MGSASPIAKSKRPQAERAAEWVLRKHWGCVVTRRAVQTKWQKVDFFGADVVGKRKNGTYVYAQVTVGKVEAVRVRRRKIEQIPWSKSDSVFLLQLVERADPVNARRKQWFFRIHFLRHKGVWMAVESVIPVENKWFKAWKEEDKE